MKILNIVGARPNFMKAAPVFKEMKKYPYFKPLLLHTGQHYDSNMSDFFFEDLELPAPDVCLSVGSFSYAKQTANIMLKLEKVIKNIGPELVVVYGDVNSTLAAALVSKNMKIKIAHVEAGLRSYDRSMPEEVNRVLTDALSDLLFTPSLDANKNLLKEKIDEEKIYFVGNTMIDSLVDNLHKIRNSHILDELNLKRKDYIVLTLHRPSNVDNKEILKNILNTIELISNKFKVVFPIHPRTSKNIKAFFPKRKIERKENFILLPPLRYMDFLKLVENSFCVMTDSGGVQEETTFLKIPCLILRECTERPVTVREGTGIILGTRSDNIIKVFNNICCGRIKKRKPRYWDGIASKRIVAAIKKYFNLR